MSLGTVMDALWILSGVLPDLPLPDAAPSHAVNLPVPRPFSW